ncbi:N-acetylmuramoyl-L-alanine amidase family protein [Litchfieldia alkalitelluris]|uniref:N-acetylmuramoyl-L-alanine amidase family protein n=1 Tax=Litchfieldia alkalitelluris TaxID=304268 RepID=UPI00099858CB|nr:N-acetylmuramoyl-L-alanine amidase [Litchfieldia alkalitelluris]
MKKIVQLTIVLFLSLVVMGNETMAEKMVVIDAGHGGKFSGTCGYSGRITGYCEKDANLEVSLKLKEVLESKGISVFLTRSTDMEFADFLRDEEGNTEGGDFSKRMELANNYVGENHANAVFISIHHNANPTNPFIRGIETYYYDGLNHFKPEYPHDPLQMTYLQDNKRLAEEIQMNLVENLKQPNRKVHNDQSFYVIRNAKMPAVLVELGFMINRHEEKLIKTSDYQQTAANSIADAVEQYFKVYEVYSSTHEKLGAFSKESQALKFAEEVKSATTVINKYNQKVVFESNAKATSQVKLP